MELPENRMPTKQAVVCRDIHTAVRRYLTSNLQNTGRIVRSTDIRLKTACAGDTVLINCWLCDRTNAAGNVENPIQERLRVLAQHC